MSGLQVAARTAATAAPCHSVNTRSARAGLEPPAFCYETAASPAVPQADQRRGPGSNRQTMALRAISRTGENRAMAPSARFERATSRSGTARAIPCTTRAWSVREESNLHAEATGLRPAERTTCSTHGWGALPESNRPCRLHRPAPSRDGKRHQSIRQDSNLRHPVCGTGALAWLSY